MKLIEVANYQDLSEKVAQIVIDKITNKKAPVLGLATGSTPECLYEILVKANNNKTVSFSNVTTFNLDEYVGLDSGDRNSYRYFMDTKLFNHIDISKQHTHVPNGEASDLNEECAHYEELIDQTGGIDLQILGIGLNGHIGFNEPGTSFSKNTHIVELESSTREANARFFDNINEVPTQAITMGINTIMKSKEIILMVAGEKKAEALHRLLEGEVSEDFPASILQKHDNVTIIADEAAMLAFQQTK